MSKAELRAPQILEMEIAGKTQTQIADALGVSRMQIWRDRQTPLYDIIREEFTQIYIEGIKELAQHENTNVRQGALKEMGQSLRSGVVKQVHSRTETAEIKIHLHEFKKNVEATQIEKED